VTAPFGGLLQSWQLHLHAANKSPRTVENYAEGVTRLHQWMVANGHPDDLATLTPDLLRMWLVDLAATMRESTVRGRYVAVKLFLTWCVVEGELDAHPMANIKQPQVAQPVVPILKPAQMHALIDDAAGSKDFVDLRDRALIMVFGDTGCRVSEVAGMGISGLDLADRSVAVVGKGNRPRVVPFGTGTAAALDRYLRGRRHIKYADRDWLWLSSTSKGKLTVNGIQQTLRKRADRLGFHLHPHMFRHGFADAWLAAGGSETDLMELAGWRSRQMVGRYGAANRAQRARDAYRSLSPMDRL